MISMVLEESIPPLYDHHTHASGKAALWKSVDISEVEDKEKAVRMIKEGCSKEEVNVVKGWITSRYSFTEKELESFPPVVICDLSFHGFILNSKAKKKLKEKFGQGRLLEKLRYPSWTEKNLPKVMKFLDKVGGITERKLDKTYRFFSEQGIWKTEDMLMPSEEVLNIFEKTGYDERAEFWVDFDTYDELSRESRTKVKGIKVFTDGALGPKTAAMNETYTEGGSGLLIYRKEKLMEFLDELKSIDKDKIAIHAIGDGAIDQVIEAVKEYEKQNDEIPYIRMEHAQFISREKAEEAKSLGMKLCMQPNFSLDSVYYQDRLTKKYQEMNNPFRMLIDEVGFVPGEDLVFGSDGMPYGVSEALKCSLFPPHSGQKLTLEEFIGGYCVDDDKKGSISVKIDEEKENLEIKDVEVAR